jgi:UDP-GlcNAc:undecaprenyl-phosphate/decaprenyl-phosphate GlcNAc-1-phosphate transferase
MNTITVNIFLACITALILCLILVPLIIMVSVKLNLVDKPNERSVHKNPIPRLGGAAIFISAIAGTVISKTGLQAILTWPVFFSSVALLFLVGIWDDLKNISARLRLIIQVCCAVSLAASGIRLTSLYGVFGIHELSIAWQYIMTVLIITGATNAFNLIDGIDGLAGGLGVISISVLVFLALKLQLYPLVILLVSFGGALVGFLKYNMNPAKIFMGDGGSLVLGYVISAAGILLIEKANKSPNLINPSDVAILITAILVIPVFDSIRVFIYRMLKGKSPFAADKTHIHHLFLVFGLNHRKTAFALYAFSVLLIVLAFLLPNATGMSFAIVSMVFIFQILTEILRLNQGVVTWTAIIKKMEREGIS